MERWSRRLAIVLTVGAAVALVVVLRRAGSTPAPSEAAHDAPQRDAHAWRASVDGACPPEFPVKVSRSGIYHVEGDRSYDRTTPERCYASAGDAEADGFRRAKA